MTVKTKYTEVKEVPLDSDNRLIAALKIAKMGYCTWDINSGEAIFSDTLLALLGYDKSDKINFDRANLEIHHPDDLNHISQWLKTCIESGKEELTPHEYRVISKKGEVIYVRTVGVIERIGKSTKVFATVQDITERKEVEKSAFNNKERLQLALEAGRMGTWDWDIKTDSVIWSDGHFRLHGYQPGSATPSYKLWCERIHPHDLPIAEHAITSAQKTQSEYNCEYRVIWPDGSIHWLEGRGRFAYDKTGKADRMFGVITDITQRKQAERNQAFTQFTVDQAKIATFWCHSDGRFFYVNETACEWLQYTREELQQMHAADISPEFSKKNWPAHWQEIKKKRLVRMESVHCRKNGEIYPVEIYSNYVKFDGEEFNLAVVHDITDRKQAEEAVRHSEERYRRIIEDQTDFIVRWQPGGTRTFVNNSYCRYFGLKREEAIGSSFLPHISQKDRKAVKQRISVLSLQNPVSTGEHKVRKPDGSYGWNQWTDRAFFDEAGNVIEYQSVGQDITERKLAEEALQASEERLSKFINSAENSYHILDTNFSILEINRAALEAIYLADPNIKSKKEVIGQSFVQIYPFLKSELPHFSQVIKTGKSYHKELTVPHPTQGNLIVSFICFKVGDGVGMIAENITDRKRAEEDLRASEKRFRSVFENSPVAIWEEDFSEVKAFLRNLKDIRNGDIDAYFAEHPDIVQTCASLVKIVDVNQAALHLHNASDKAELMAGLEKTFTKASIETFRKGLVAIVKGETVHHSEGKLKTLDGHEREVDVRWSIVPGFEESLARVLVTIEDITERKRAEEELQKYQQELEKMVEGRTAELQASNKELQAFAYSISHDLRTPLRSINGFSQALLEDYHDALDEQGQDYLNRLRHTSVKMAALTDDLLELSRITRQEIRKEKINLTKIARKITKELKLSEPKRKVKVIINPKLTMLGDDNLMKIALENLLSNAWKFTQKKNHAKIELGAETVNGKTTYYVRDDGAGFDPNYSDKLFGAFQRLHSNDEFEGTGIGLATVQRIVQRHGGKIWAEAEVEKGATFYMEFPNN